MEDLVLASTIDKICKEKGCEIKPIPTFLGEYFASSHGNIYSYKLKRWKELKPAKHWKGYLFFTLYKNKKRSQHKAHRLVLWSFFGQSSLEVNHINANKADNRLENLEYTSAKENTQHAVDIGRRKGRKLTGQELFDLVVMAHAIYKNTKKYTLTAKELNRRGFKTARGRTFNRRRACYLIKTNHLDDELNFGGPLGLRLSDFITQEAQP